MSATIESAKDELTTDSEQHHLEGDANSSNDFHESHDEATDAQEDADTYAEYEEAILADYYGEEYEDRGPCKTLEQKLAVLEAFHNQKPTKSLIDDYPGVPIIEPEDLEESSETSDPNDKSD